MTRIRWFNSLTWLKLVLPLVTILASFALVKNARADQLSDDLAGLASADSSEVSAAIVKAANHGDARALPALRALDDGTLRFDALKHLLISGQTSCVATVTATVGNPRISQVL